MEKNKKDNFKLEFNKRLVKFSLSIIALCRELKKDHLLWPIVDQLMRSATSIGANVIEVKGSSSKKDYIRFFEIAYKSANETQYWLILVRESTKLNVSKLLTECQEIAKIICSGIITMKSKN